MPNAAIQFSQVTKRYGTTAALEDFSFSVSPGECVALAGVNGAGKTTLLKCLLDLVSINAGDIVIFGVPHRQTSSRASLAFLPERFSPPYYLTGRDFLSYMARLDGGQFNPARVADMFNALDLDLAVLDKPVRLLSKGMTQKLGLAACLLSDKQLYVLDEPMSGLDPRARARVKAEVTKLKQRGKTLFFTSHALADAEELGDTLAVLHNGKMRFQGTPEALCSQYAAHGSIDLEQAFLRCIEES